MSVLLKGRRLDPNAFALSTWTRMRYSYEGALWFRLWVNLCHDLNKLPLCLLQHVTRLVDLLTKPRPIMIDGVRAYAEIAKPLKNQKWVPVKSKTGYVKWLQIYLWRLDSFTFLSCVYFLPSYRREYDKSNTSLLGNPPDVMEVVISVLSVLYPLPYFMLFYVEYTINAC